MQGIQHLKTRPLPHDFANLLRLNDPAKEKSPCGKPNKKPIICIKYTKSSNTPNITYKCAQTVCVYMYIYIYVSMYIYIHICVCFRGWQAIQAISVPGAQTEGSGGAWAIQGFPKMGTFLQQNIGFPLKTFPTA